MTSHPGFRFKISPAASGWSWTTYDAKRGQKLSEGTAATRAQAAACVIRFIARNSDGSGERQPPRTARQRAAARSA